MSFGAFLTSCNRKEREEALTSLRQIIFKGRQAGIFVILSTQKPKADTIPTDISDQLGLQVALRNMSNEGYKMVFGKHSFDTYKSCSPGTGYFHIQGSNFMRPLRFEAPYIDSEVYRYLFTTTE